MGAKTFRVFAAGALATAAAFVLACESASGGFWAGLEGVVALSEGGSFEIPSGDAGANPASEVRRFSIEGTVHFGQTLKAGTKIAYLGALLTSKFAGPTVFPSEGVINGLIFRSPPEIKTLTAPADSSSFSYTNLAPGLYRIGFLTDSTSDERFGEGDIAGFYGGTYSKPTLIGLDAKIIDIRQESAVGIQVELGPITCLQRWGGGCQRNIECAVGTCTEGKNTSIFDGLCEPSTSRCVNPVKAENKCPAIGQGGCLNWNDPPPRDAGSDAP